MSDAEQSLGVPMDMKRNQLNELLCQALETELGGVKVYEMALQCAVNEDLKQEWTEYLGQTRDHVRVLRELFALRGLDPDVETPGRQVVRHIGESLVMAMRMALRSGGPPAAAQLVAAECVVDAETKDHMNWELIGRAGRALGSDEGAALKSAYEQIEDQEDEHLYHTKGWCRELWLASLGLDAQLPPPEETQNANSAMAAARVKQARMEKR